MKLEKKVMALLAGAQVSMLNTVCALAADPPKTSTAPDASSITGKTLDSINVKDVINGQTSDSGLGKLVSPVVKAGNDLVGLVGVAGMWIVVLAIMGLGIGILVGGSRQGEIKIRILLIVLGAILVFSAISITAILQSAGVGMFG